MPHLHGGGDPQHAGPNGFHSVYCTYLCREVVDLRGKGGVHHQRGQAAVAAEAAAGTPAPFQPLPQLVVGDAIGVILCVRSVTSIKKPLEISLTYFETRVFDSSSSSRRRGSEQRQQSYAKVASPNGKDKKIKRQERKPLL